MTAAAPEEPFFSVSVALGALFALLAAGTVLLWALRWEWKFNVDDTLQDASAGVPPSHQSGIRSLSATRAAFGVGASVGSLLRGAFLAFFAVVLAGGSGGDGVLRDPWGFFLYSSPLLVWGFAYSVMLFGWANCYFRADAGSMPLLLQAGSHGVSFLRRARGIIIVGNVVITVVCAVAYCLDFITRDESVHRVAEMTVAVSVIVLSAVWTLGFFGLTYKLYRRKSSDQAAGIARTPEQRAVLARLFGLTLFVFFAAGARTVVFGIDLTRENGPFESWPMLLVKVGLLEFLPMLLLVGAFTVRDDALRVNLRFQTQDSRFRSGLGFD
jgi:hypothetical protein